MFLKKSEEKKQKNYILLFWSIVIFLVLVLLDYFNIPFKCDIYVENINMDFWVLFINSFIVIVLYFFTYFLIDKRIAEQNQNKKNIALEVLINTYKMCLDDIKWMENDEFRTKASSKISDNEDFNSNNVFNRLVESPFENHEMIISFAKEGVITAIQLREYIKIRNEFRKFITMSIIWYDRFDLVLNYKNEIKKFILDVLDILGQE